MKKLKDIAAGLLLLASMSLAPDAKAQISKAAKDDIFTILQTNAPHHTNQKFATNTYQKQMLQRRFSYHTNMQIVRMPVQDRKHPDPFVQEDSTIYIVDDITISQIPLLIKHMTNVTYGAQTPHIAASHSIQKNLYTYIKIMQSYKESSALDSILVDYVSLYQDLYPTAPDPLTVTDTTYIDQNLYTQYVASHIDNIDIHRVVDSLLTDDIVGGLYTAVFESGAKNIRSVSNLDKIVPMQTYKDRLKKANITANKKTIATQQKKIITDIIAHINKSDISKTYARSYLHESIPTKIVQTKQIACVGLSTLMHGFLEELGIQHQGLIMQSHVALQLTLADGSSRYCDLTKPLGKNLVPYHTITLGDGGSSIVLAATDTIHVVTDDPEKVLISDILYNDQFGMKQIDDKDVVTNKLVILQQGLRIDPKNHMILRDMAQLYYHLGDYIRAKQYIKKALTVSHDNKLYLQTYKDILMKLNEFGPEFISVDQQLKKLK